MEQSESIKALLESLVNVQAELSTLPKDKQGYGYKYTELDTVISSIKPLFTKYKLGFMQSLTVFINKPAITTRIFNTLGEWIEDTTLLPEISVGKTNAAQNLGAAITYMKRYALCAMLGISSDEDVDAATVTPKDEGKNEKVNSSKPTLKGGPDTPEQKAKIKALLDTTDADGKRIFSNEERKQVAEWRKTTTADEVIKSLEQYKKDRMVEIPQEVF